MTFFVLFLIVSQVILTKDFYALLRVLSWYFPGITYYICKFKAHTFYVKIKLNSVFLLHCVALNLHWISPAILLPGCSISSKLSFSTSSCPYCPGSLYEHHTLSPPCWPSFSKSLECWPSQNCRTLRVTSLFCQGLTKYSTSFQFLNCFSLKLHIHSFF